MSPNLNPPKSIWWLFYHSWYFHSDCLNRIPPATHLLSSWAFASTTLFVIWRWVFLVAQSCGRRTAKSKTNIATNCRSRFSSDRYQLTLCSSSADDANFQLGCRLLLYRRLRKNTFICSLSKIRVVIPVASLPICPYLVGLAELFFLESVLEVGSFFEIWNLACVLAAFSLCCKCTLNNFK